MLDHANGLTLRIDKEIFVLKNNTSEMKINYLELKVAFWGGVFKNPSGL